LFHYAAGQRSQLTALERMFADVNPMWVGINERNMTTPPLRDDNDVGDFDESIFPSRYQACVDWPVVA
jgi:hypothetical protein